MIDDSYLLDSGNNLAGSGHFTFGGILQSYTQNKGTQGNPLYSVQVVDPREILANTSLILNNYQGTTFNNKNLMNIYGFLEYDISDDLKLNFFEVKLDASGDPNASGTPMFSGEILTKSVDTSGVVSYSGLDVYKTGKGIFSTSPLSKYFSDAAISSGLAIMACNKNLYAPKANIQLKNKVNFSFAKYDNKGNFSKIIQ